MTIPCVQVYRIVVEHCEGGGASSPAESLEMHMSLCYCMGMEDCGPVWDLQWCACDGWDDEDLDCDGEGDSEGEGEVDVVLGLLGVLCGDGVCRVLLMPTPAALGIDDATSTEADVPSAAAARGGINAAPLISASRLHRWELGLHGDMVTCLAWGLVSRPYVVACGMSSGRIALWDLTKFVAESQGTTPVPRPSAGDALPRCTSFSPHWQLVDLRHYEGPDLHAAKTAVRSIVFCPYSADVLCTGGHDGVVKVPESPC